MDKPMLKFVFSLNVIWFCAIPGFGAKIFIFNPHSEPVTADVEFVPSAVGLKGVKADHVQVVKDDKNITAQAEDSDLDGKITDNDTVYTAFWAKPGNNWLEVKAGKPAPAARVISIQRQPNRLRAGWMELEARTGRPVAWQVKDKEWKPIEVDTGTPVGEWQKLTGRATVSDLPLRSRVDFLSQAEYPVQITVLVFPNGRTEIQTRYPKGLPAKAWQENRDQADRPYFTQAVTARFPLVPDAGFNWLTKSGTWHTTKENSTGYRLRLFFAGIAYPQPMTGLGVFMMDLDPNTAEKPCAMWPGRTTSPTLGSVWQTGFSIYLTSSFHRFSLVRYSPADNAARAPQNIRQLYDAPQIYIGRELREMIEARIKFLKCEPARQALAEGNLREALNLLEQTRSRLIASAEQKMKTLADLKQTAPLLDFIGQTQTLLKAQDQDRSHPRRFVRTPWAQSPYSVDRLIRADQRLAEGMVMLSKAESVGSPEKIALAETLVSGPGEVFRAGFGECGGLNRELFDLVWGYDYFQRLIEIGVKNFHFQAIWWSEHGRADGSIFGLEGYDRLFERFDRAGATIVPQLRPYSWCGIPEWIKDKSPDSLYEYMFQQAGADGKLFQEKRKQLVWMSPEIWGSVLSFQKAYAEYCRKVVAALGRHPSIVGWAEHNEDGASAQDGFGAGRFSTEGFRKYLKRKYPTIAALNTAWGTKFSGFDQIPTAAPEENTTKTLSLNLDGPWRFAVDPAQKGQNQNWMAPNFDDRSWETINVPGYWEGQFPKYKNYDGLAWYRREVDIPAEWAGKIIRFHCDGIDDDAVIFINGKPAIKNHGFNVPIAIDITKLINPGRKNTLAVCVNDTFADGGIYKPVLLTAQSDQIPPPRFKQPQRQLDREMFAQENAAGICAYHSRVIHEADPNHRPAFLKEWVLKTPSEDPSSQLDSFLASGAHFGAVGCDMYKSMSWYPKALDMLRSAGDGKPVWLMETLYYAPRESSPESLDQWTWSMAVRGLRSVYFWISDGNAYEGDCGINDFGVGVARMQKKFDALAPVLAGRRKIDVAIYLPRDSQYLCDRAAIDKSWRGIWDTLNILNIPTDFIDDTRIEAGKLKKYKCLIVPYSPFLSERMAKKISEFVRSGGCVLMRQGTAVYDYQGNTFAKAPGWGLDELFRTHPKQALLTATDIGEQFENTPEPHRTDAAKTIRTLLGQYGVLPPFHCYQPGIEAHLLEKDKTASLVLINHNQEAGKVRLTMEQTGWTTAYDLETLEKIELKTNAFTSIPISPNAVRLFALKPK
jgi:hypothetical protein